MLRKLLLIACFAGILCSYVAGRAQEVEYSGPQVGERLVPFTVRLARGERAGEEFRPVDEPPQGRIMLVFVHEVTRPSIAVTRSVIDYARRYQADGLQSAVIFLTSDPTDTETWIRRAQHAMPQEVPLGISVDGLEGPGAYGLNRKMTLTILLADDHRVTANFALVQPSLAADAPHIGAAIEQLMGRDHEPTLAEMGITDGPAMRERGGDDGSFRRLLAPVIRRTADAEDVARAAKAVEARAESDPAFRRQVGQAARRIVDAGVLENYGTPEAQTYLKKWADEWGRGADATPRTALESPADQP